MALPCSESSEVADAEVNNPGQTAEKLSSAPIPLARAPLLPCFLLLRLLPGSPAAPRLLPCCSSCCDDAWVIRYVT